VFNVSSWSNYSIGAGEFCGDGIKNGVEECDVVDFGGLICGDYGLGTGSLTCDAFCTIGTSGCNPGGGGEETCTPSCPSASETTCGSSLGDDGCGEDCSGEGTLCSEGETCTDGSCVVDEVCVESWSCGGWTTCAAEEQTRTCTDANACGTELLKPIETQACVEDCVESWSCSDWATCTDEEQTRTCTDDNSCGTNMTQPIELTSCVENCTSEISCGSWDECLSDSQTRTCTDDNSCIADYEESQSCESEYEELEDEEDIPSELTSLTGEAGGLETCEALWGCKKVGECEGEYAVNDLIFSKEVKGIQRKLCEDFNECKANFYLTEDCSFKVPVLVETTSWCNEDYLEVRDVDGEVLARIKDGGNKDYLNLDLNLVGKGYCEYCHDNILNYDEEEVDCGGSCISCDLELEQPKQVRSSLLTFFITLIVFIALFVVIMTYLIKNLIIGIKKEELDYMFRKYQSWKKKGFQVNILDHHIKNLKKGD